MSTAAVSRPEASALTMEQWFGIQQFLFYEAELLDDRRWRDWLGLLADDFTYLLPMPVTRDNPALPAYDEHAYLMAENRFTLDGWVHRLGPERIDTAWSENPPARIRHFVSNVRPRPGEQPGEMLVRSNVLVSIARLDEEPARFTSERHDVLRSAPDGAWAIASRRVYIDQNLPTWSMRLII